MEAIACIERLNIEMYTGDQSNRPFRLFNILGVLRALNSRGFPTINRSILDLTNLKINRPAWPRNPDTGLPYLASLAGITYHFGSKCSNEYALRASALMIPVQSGGHFNAYHQYINNILRHSMLLELRAWMQTHFRAQAAYFKETADASSFEHSAQTKLKETLEYLCRRWENESFPLKARCTQVLFNL
jgi:hypothetical protein